MSPDKGIIENSKDKIPFPELEDKGFAESLVIELVKNGEFSDEQIQRIISFSVTGINGDIDEERFVKCHRVKHVTFSPSNDPSRLFLFLTHPEEWYHTNIWGIINTEFNESLTLRDGGYFEITEEDKKPYISTYISKGLSQETGKITPEECFQCRAQISEMDIGIEILE